MARALRRTPVGLLVAGLIALSAALHWLAAARVGGLWIMPDEAIYGTRALTLWEHGSLPLVGRSGAGYSALYPLVAGLPLSIGSLSTGYALVKPVQAVLMSLAAWPVYAYTRSLVAARYALLAAALTLAIPLVLFSGFLMTEVVYYPLAAAALLMCARAVATRARTDQIVALVLIAAAVATRVQAVVLLLVLAAASLVDAALAHRRPSLRAFWPVWALVALGAVVTVARPGAFGAYATAVDGGYAVAPALRLALYHLAYLIVAVGAVPVAALVLLLVDAARGRADRDVRALVSVAACAVVLVVVQVGVFGSRFAPHLLERDLAALPPLLFVVLAVWLGRGAPRRAVAASLTVLALVAVVVSTPWNRLVTWDSFPDSVGIALPLERPLGWTPALAITVAVVILLVLFRFLPSPAVAAALVLGLLCWDSARAAQLVRQYAAGTQQVLVGTPRDWIERTARGPVAYVYDGDLAGWPVVWEQRFWNPRIRRVISLAPHAVPGPIAQTQIQTPATGRLPIGERYVVANDRLAFAGTALARQDRGPNQYPLVLWRLSTPPRMSSILAGVQPNGDMTAPARMKVFDCAGGSLALTLLPKASESVEVDLAARPVVRAHVAGLASWSTTIPVASSHRGTCVFTIRGGPLLGSTRIEFVRAS